MWLNSYILRFRTAVADEFKQNDSHTLPTRFFRELVVFGGKNAISCIFPVFIFVSLWLSPYITPSFMYRYDMLLLLCLSMQAAMFYFRMETFDEVKVITLFHLLGLIMEIYKVHVGSWSYPEDAYTKVFNVPIYSGFMYASVASFMTQAWRRFDLQLVKWPKNLIAIAIGAAIYLNFFFNYYYDIRYFIFAAIFIAFFFTKIKFTNNGPAREMPLVLTFLLIGFFVWIAENIATFLGAWKYPYQHQDWQMVGFSKISSWFLMVIVSLIIVVQLKFIKKRKENSGVE
jgi:uncharacterized membrane protein YoaT (DUF817 family)